MEYIAGTDLLTFIKQNGTTWLPVLISQLLTDLDYLHKNGWVFGDLKPENLLVTKSPVKIRCIDVGGTTMQGRAIKEFTEFLTGAIGDLARGVQNLLMIFLQLP